MSGTANSIYQVLKNIEGQFTPPAPYFYLNVGTLDVDNGGFTGLSSVVIKNPEGNPPPVRHGAGGPSPDEIVTTTTIYPKPIVPLQPVQLEFTVSRPLATGWTAIANDITLQATPGQTTINIDVWDASGANWTIQANGITHSDRMILERPAGILTGALGAFTIPVLPVTIIYAPPADSLGNSAAIYTQGQTVGQTTDITNSLDTSKTVPQQVVGPALMASFFNLAAGFLTAAAGAPGAPASGVAEATLEAGMFSTAATQIGTVTASQTTGITDQNETTMTMTTTTSTGIGTTAHAGGPGVGDAIYFFRDVQMAWGYFQGGLRLCPFGYTNVLQPVSEIQNNAAGLGLSAEDAASLLALDPFVGGGPGATPPADRFEFIENWDYGHGTEILPLLSVTRDTKQIDTTINYSVDTSTWDAGPILKGFGFGGSTQTTVKVSNAIGSDVSSTITASATLASGPNDEFVVDIWYDQVFGTYAFQELVPASTPLLQGTGAKPGETVTLLAGGRKFNTMADSSGAYAFRAPTIPPGPATLTISGTATPVTIQA